MKLKLEEIGCDPKYYPRVNGHEDWLTAYRYKEALIADPSHEFPPVVVVRATGFEFPYVLLDGKHRTKAYASADRESIPASVERLPRSKWFARSVELNATHGRGLDTGDKAWIAERLNEEGYSDSDVAKLLHMPLESLEKIKATRIVKLTGAAKKVLAEGRGNRTLDRGHVGFLKGPLCAANGTTLAMEALAHQGHVSAHDVSDILDSFIAVLRSGVLDMTNLDIAVKMSAIRELLA